MRGGRREVTVPAPLDRLPLMIRAGAVLPLLPPRLTRSPRTARTILRS